MKRFLALLLTLGILFSMAAMNVTAVGNQAVVEELIEQEGEHASVQDQEGTAPVLNDDGHTDHAACACAISGADCADHSTAAAAVTITTTPMKFSPAGDAKPSASTPEKKSKMPSTVCRMKKQALCCAPKVLCLAQMAVGCISIILPASPKYEWARQITPAVCV